MDKTAAGLVARHALSILAGWLVAKGYISAGDVEPLIGVGLGIAALVWSVIQKKNAAKDTAKAVEGAGGG